MYSNYKNFKDAKIFVKGLNLKSNKEWREYYKSDNMPEDIPSNPERTYKDEWRGWGDWLGTKTLSSINRSYMSFDEARKYVRALKLDSVTEWEKIYCKSGKRPSNLPSNPQQKYKEEGWINWSDFLGNKKE